MGRSEKFEDVLKFCDLFKGFNADGRKEKLLEFLDRQATKHPEYDLNYRKANRGRGNGITVYPWMNVLIDAVILRDYMLGKIPIIAGSVNNERVVRIGRFLDGALKPISERKGDLVLLAPSQIGVNKRYKMNRTDKQLYTLANRAYSRKGLPTFRDHPQGWGMLINSVGNDPEIIEYFGEIVEYRRDVSAHRKIVIS